MLSSSKFIGRRFSLLLIIMMTIVVIVAATWTTHANKQRTLNIMERATNVVAGLMQTIIYRPMMAGDDATTRQEFANLAQKHPTIEMYMSSFLDKITYSTDLSSVDKTVAESKLPPIIKDEINLAIGGNYNFSNLIEYEDKWYFTRISSIPNAPECHHCHGSSKPILGQFTIMRDVTPAMTELKHASYRTAGLGIFALIVMVLFLRLFVRKIIVERLSALRDASQDVANGNLDADFRVEGEDELHSLSENLASMVANIKKEMGFSKSILKGISVPYLVIDTDARLTWCNQQILDAVGLNADPEDCIGIKLKEFTTRVGIGEEMLLSVLVTEKDVIDRPLSFVNLRGEEKHFITTACALYDLDNKLIGAFSVGVDVTEIRKQQNIVEEQNTRIAQSAESASGISSMVAENSHLLAEQVASAQGAALNILEQTQSSVIACEQMQVSSLSVTDKAVHASELAINASSEANEGRAVVQNAVQCIGEVMGQVSVLANDMSSLGSQASEITRIISVIDEIADQTNLLALNAAIEAARAGDAGRGFAVVADEVRKLAEKTQEATKHVNDSINSIVEGINLGAEEVNKTLELMETATDFSQQSGEALERIHGMIQNTADNISIMASAAHEQTATVESMAEGVSIINSITANTVEAMNVADNAVKELDTTVQKLNTIIANMVKE